MSKKQDNKAQEDFAFPKEWAMFGPVGKDAPEPDFAGMTAIPKELAIAGKRLAGQKAAFTDTRLDLGALLGGKGDGKTAYLLATIHVREAGPVTLGAVADWWMKWWVNGQVVCDALTTGNDAHPPGIADRVFVAPLRAGPDLIAAKVVSGSGSFVVAAGGPRELRQRGASAGGSETVRERALAHVRHCQVLAHPTGPWSLTWSTDYAAYAPRDPKGGAFVRPLPDDVGRTRLRFVGLPVPGQQTRLISAKGPWVAIINQPLSNHASLYSNVGFLDATDHLVETHAAETGETASRFVHVMEGFREGKTSAIKSVALVPLKAGNEGSALAVEVARADGTLDVIVWQEAPAAIELANGLATDARYALVRLDAAGQAMEAHLLDGSYLRGRSLDLSGPARFTGTVVDLVGDLTGTRRESALIIRPDGTWPAQLATGCGQAIVEGPDALRAPFREAFSLGRITAQTDGTVRLDLAKSAPLAVGWHQVSELDPKRPDFFRTNRPMLAGSQTPWYQGMNVWFPRLNKTFRFKTLTGGFHGSTEATLDGVGLAAEGIRPGDWFVIHFLQPGMKVTILNAMVWRG